MLKRILTLITLLCLTYFLPAQSIKYFFKKLPSYLTNELNVKTKDSILEGKNYYPASNDSEEVIVYRLETLDLKKNCLRIEMNYESGQRGFQAIELRSFKTNTGNSIVVFSDYSGVPHDYSQNNLSVFSYTKDKKLTKILSTGLITKVSFKDFLKPGTPDSLIKKYESHFNINYVLVGEDDISLNLYGELDPKELHDWLAGDIIKFVWNGKRFIKQRPVFID